MKSEIKIFNNHDEASNFVANLFAEKLNKNPKATITLAAGDTPLAFFEKIISKQNLGEVDLKSAKYIGLDEWIGLGPQDAGSCINIMNTAFYNPAGIPRENIKVFDGLTNNIEGEIEQMNEVLAENPLDIAVLGVGVNGHIGFNEPNVQTTNDFSLVPLSETTQKVGKKYFDGKDTVKMGATITLKALKEAKTVIILATGENKKEAVSGIILGDSKLPVGEFINHSGAVYVFDNNAAGV